MLLLNTYLNSLVSMIFFIFNIFLFYFTLELTASFRGRPLNGKKLTPPSGYESELMRKFQYIHFLSPAFCKKK